MKKQTRAVYLGYIFINALILIGIVCTVGLPLLVYYAAPLKFLLLGPEELRFVTLYVTALVDLSGIIALIMLFFARMLLKNIMADRTFCADNAKLLKCIGWSSLALAVLYSVSAFVLATSYSLFFACAIVCAIFILILLFCFIFASVITTATEYKEENDLTV